MPVNKVSAYAGFSIRAGKAVFGVDALEQYRKKVFLIIVSESLGENSFKTVLKMQKKFKCALIRTNGVSLGDIVHRENCKCIALTDKSLSEAALSAAGGDDHFVMYPWEEQE